MRCRCSSTGRPSNRTDPLTCGVRPRIAFRSVLFPAPFGPITTTTPPPRMSRPTSELTASSPYPAVTRRRTRPRLASLTALDDTQSRYTVHAMTSRQPSLDTSGRLAAAGGRVTRQRLLIADHLAAAGRQLTADELYRRLRT